MSQSPETFDVVTITLNPAIDRTLTIPNFTAGQVNRVENERSQAGGKGVNVAAALAGHGLEVAVTGFLGRDNPQLFEQLFADKEIADRFVRISGQTRTGIKINDPLRHETTDVNFPGFAPEPDDLEALESQLDSMAAEYFVLSGSLPVGIAPAVYGRLISNLKRRGMRVALDTSGAGLKSGLESVPDLIKPNIHELEELMGHELTGQRQVIKAARELVSQGIGLVVVSMGKQGALFVTKTEAFSASAPEVEIGSTVGAGDAMVAGIVAGQLARLPLEECAHLATTFSLRLLTGNCPAPAPIVERV